ncbi:MAG TPA: hypothetical protein DIT01_17250 [Lentisphaeria bacterium]|nr:hypothetical protein [Lentisphaeria bacterium]
MSPLFVGLATATVAVMATKSCAVPVQRAALPAVPESWKFRLDPDDAGHQEKWFDLDIDDRGWRDVKIGATWESQGIDYDGVAGFHVVLHAAQPGEGTALELIP